MKSSFATSIFFFSLSATSAKLSIIPALTKSDSIFFIANVKTLFIGSVSSTSFSNILSKSCRLAFASLNTPFDKSPRKIPNA